MGDWLLAGGPDCRNHASSRWLEIRVFRRRLARTGDVVDSQGRLRTRNMADGASVPVRRFLCRICRTFCQQIYSPNFGPADDDSVRTLRLVGPFHLDPSISFIADKPRRTRLWRTEDHRGGAVSNTG